MSVVFVMVFVKHPLVTKPIFKKTMRKSKLNAYSQISYRKFESLTKLFTKPIFKKIIDKVN